MKLYLVHCGYYDLDIGEGIYEFHVNFPVVGADFEDAKRRVRERPDFISKKMHVDGIQEIEAVRGWRIKLEEDLELKGRDLTTSLRHRDLASVKRD